MKKRVACLTIFLSFMVLVTGCVSNKRHNREIGNLQTQVNTLGGEVAKLDSQVQSNQKPPAFGFLGAQPAVAPTPAPVKRSTSYVASATYKTPSGFEVPAADIQRALKTAGYFNDEADGKVGPKTRDAIRAFQHDNGLKADGVCGKKTWDLLKTHLSSEGTSSPIK